jgi:peptidyl-tRNA hydrolase
MSSIDFVLGKFSFADKAVVSEVVGKAADAVEYFCKSGIDAAMNRFNNQA